MPIRAFVLVMTEPGRSEDIVRARHIRGVKIANSVFGRFDAVVVIEAKDLEELRRIIYEMVEKTEGVIHTETLIALFYPPE
jgi:uncharacterized protein with GYD domain